MISSDRKIFEKGSAVRARFLEYGRLVDELHVIVFARKSLAFLSETFPPNISIYPTRSTGKIFYVSSAIFSALKLKRRGVSIDVVTTQDPFEAGLAGYIIARIFSARLHLQIHTDVMSPYFASESILNRVRVQIAKFLIPRADAVRVVSSRIKKSIEHLVRSGTSIAILPIFIEIKDAIHSSIGDLKKKYPQFSSRILITARLSREKNIGSTIKAMQAVVQKHKKAGLIIVGDGPEAGELKRLVKELGLEENIMFEGWQDELLGYYKTADVFVLPSSYEGYGMVVVEALSQGCPVIMTDVGCAGDVVTDRENGLIVPVGDTQALENAIERIVSGELKLTPQRPSLPTKEEYLAMYLKSWESALH